MIFKTYELCEQFSIEVYDVTTRSTHYCENMSVRKGGPYVYYTPVITIDDSGLSKCYLMSLRKYAPNKWL